MTNGYLGKEPPVLAPNMVILTNTHAGMKSFHVDTVVALLPRVQFRDHDHVAAYQGFISICTPVPGHMKTGRILLEWLGSKGRFLEKSLKILKHILAESQKFCTDCEKPHLGHLAFESSKKDEAAAEVEAGSIQGRWVSMTSSILPHDFPGGKGMKRHEKAALGEKFLWISLGFFLRIILQWPSLESWMEK